MQLGFVIDHSRCIGCHACTVACKAENDVPVGSFRTWVKYTEEGAFPRVRRSFAVLRCNQCTLAPCVTICPVRALEKRPDGIVDVDPAACIGCKACMQGCPYDALYINDATGTAEKCHFCAHRVEKGLAPACAVVCPTEAIVPGDLDDPASAASRLRARHTLAARKTEAGTGPNVLYREVSPAGIDPSLTDRSGAFLWANRHPSLDLDADTFLALEDAAEGRARARTTYDVDRPPSWGFKVSAYLFTKSIAAGIFLAMALLATPLSGAGPGRGAMLALSASALFFLAVTTVLLVADLRRPERFLFILRRPNWSSWLARGALVLMGYGGVLVVWSGAVWWKASAGVLAALLAAGCLLAALAACYTGWLFAQSKGRVLWMRRGLWLHLIFQAGLAGTAFCLLVAPLVGIPADSLGALRWSLLGWIAVHALGVAFETRGAPAGREEEYGRAAKLVTRGPYAGRHWALGVVVGIVVPGAALLTPFPLLWSVASVAALWGLFVEEDVLVRAGQALAIS